VNDETEILTKNILFLAVTRPALWAGIPMEAAVLLLIMSASVLIETNSPVYAALVVAFGYSISRLIVRHDVNAFRLLFLWGRTKLGMLALTKATSCIPPAKTRTLRGGGAKGVCWIGQTGLVVLVDPALARPSPVQRACGAAIK
jgi:type IV secretion system protein VirB3